MLCSLPRSTRRPWARRCVVPLLDVALHEVIKNTDVPGGLAVLFADFKWQNSYFGWSYERREHNRVLDTKWYGGNFTLKIDTCEVLKFQMSALVWAFSVMILFMPKTLYVSSGDSELDRMSSGWITSPSLSRFGGSYPQGFQTCPFSVGVCSLSRDLWQATPTATTKQTTPYAKNYGLQAYWTR